MKRTLIDISDDLRALDDLLIDSGGDISDPLVARAIESWFEELDKDMTTKVDNYAAYITELAGRASVRKAEADRLALRARVDTNAAKHLKERLKFVLENRGIKTLETPRYRVSIAGNGGKAPLDVSVPASELSPPYQKISVSPDNDAIRKALDAGAKIPGCILMDRGTSLRIR